MPALPLNVLELFAVILVTAALAATFAHFLFRATQDWWADGEDRGPHGPRGPRGGA